MVYNDYKMVIIKDKYPKSKYHFLAIPKEKILNVSHLNRSHIALIKDLKEKVLEHIHNEVTDPSVNFLFGFHALPSMDQLHLHVISDDFDSKCLKTKQHWNSFNTEFFLSVDSIIDELESEGKIVIDHAKYKALHDQPLEKPLAILKKSKKIQKEEEDLPPACT